MVGLSRSTIFVMISEGTLPRPVRLSKGLWIGTETGT